MNGVRPLDDWIDHVFDHAVSDPPWYYASAHATPTPCALEKRGEDVVEHIAETFENAGELLSRFSDEQLGQGFWYLFYPGETSFMETLLDSGILLESRRRALRSSVPVFEQVMARRCSSSLSHLPDTDANANDLNSACYMWFDVLLDRFRPQKLREGQLDADLIATLGAILAIPHDACRESALHGIGHWVRHYPELAGIVDQFLKNNPALPPELVAYARDAKAGNVL
jgi:hypothetical protein